jgi:hypothetical protein
LSISTVTRVTVIEKFRFCKGGRTLIIFLDAIFELTKWKSFECTHLVELIGAFSLNINGYFSRYGRKTYAQGPRVSLSFWPISREIRTYIEWVPPIDFHKKKRLKSKINWQKTIIHLFAPIYLFIPQSILYFWFP